MKRKPINNNSKVQKEFTENLKSIANNLENINTKNLKVIQMPPEKPDRINKTCDSCLDVENELLAQSIYDIPNIMNGNTVEKLTEDPVCPIFYDSTGNLICIPSPHDVAIRALHNNINGYNTVDYYLAKDNDSREVTNSSIVESIRTTTLNAFTDQMMNAVMGFLTENIGRNFTYKTRKYIGPTENTDYFDITNYNNQINPNNNEAKFEDSYRVVTGIKSLLYEILSDNHLYRYHLNEIIESFIYQESTANSFETKNNILYYNINLHRDGIVSNIASALEKFIRHNIYNNNPATTDMISGYEYKEYMRQLNVESGREITEQLFFFMQSFEYTSMLNSMVPMIDAILWKMINTLNYLMTDDIKKQIRWMYRNSQK